MAARKKKKRRVFRYIMAGLIIAAALYVGFVFLKHWKNLQALQAQRDALAQQLDDLQEENEALRREIDFSKTPDFIERMAREILGWVKPGEIKFVEGETPAPLPTQTPDATEPEP